MLSLRITVVTMLNSTQDMNEKCFTPSLCTADDIEGQHQVG